MGQNDYINVSLKFTLVKKQLSPVGLLNPNRSKKTQGLGAGMYVKKPYTLEKIGMAIRDELSRTR